MAGDWIKLEHATAYKPEVAQAAELLGISRREMVGVLVDYWIWLDQNVDESRNGIVTHMSRKSVDVVFNCAGLAAVLERIGWAQFDDKDSTLTVVNWGRHNGNTAKSRALNRDRQERYRNASVTQGALPEKRREEVVVPIGTVELKSFVGEESPSPLNGVGHGKAKSAIRATRLPADWSLPDDWRDWAVAAYRMDPQAAVRLSLGFRDWFLQKPGADGTSLDWRRRWQVWVRREMEGKRA